MNGTFSIHKRDFVWAQYGIVTTLLFLGLLLYIYQSFNGVDLYFRAFGVFDVDKEASVPTWFSAINLLLSACLLLSIYAASRERLDNGSRYWLFLGLVFLALSIDEVAGFHERAARLTEVTVLLFAGDVPSAIFQGPLRVLFGNWILPGIIVCIVAFLFFLPFLRILPRRTAGLFLLAGAIYIGGALGFEIVGDWSYVNEITQYGDFLDSIRILVEEAAEMFGIALFNCVLFGELTKEDQTLTIQIGATH